MQDLIKFSKNKKKNKKGDVSISMNELIGAFLALIIILGIVYLTVKLTNIINHKGNDYQSTVSNFDLLGERIEKLLQDKNYANRDFVYFLHNDYVLIGYSHTQTELRKTEAENLRCGRNFLLNTRKIAESQCGKSCICLYKYSKFDNENTIPAPIKCKSFDKNIIFLAPDSSEFCSVQTIINPLNVDKAYPTIPGVYKDLALNGFGTAHIYIDKYSLLPEQGDETFIFAGMYSEDNKNPVYQRKLYMDEQYKNGIPVSGISRKILPK